MGRKVGFVWLCLWISSIAEDERVDIQHVNIKNCKGFICIKIRERFTQQIRDELHSEYLLEDQKGPQNPKCQALFWTPQSDTQSSKVVELYVSVWDLGFLQLHGFLHFCGLTFWGLFIAFCRFLFDSFLTFPHCNTFNVSFAFSSCGCPLLLPSPSTCCSI